MKKYIMISFVVLFSMFVFAKEHEETLVLCDVAEKEMSDQAQAALTLKKRNPSSQKLPPSFLLRLLTTKDTVKLHRTCRCDKAKRKNKECGKLGKKFLNILTYFSNMFHHFICLLQRVNDKQGIQEPILGLFESMAHIIMEGIKNGELSPDATQEELQAYLEKVSKNIAPYVRGIIIKHTMHEDC